MENERVSCSSPVNPFQGPVNKPGRAALHFSKPHRRTELRIFSCLKKKSGRILWDMGFLSIFFILLSGFTGKASWYDSNSVKKEGTRHAEKCYTASGKEIHTLEKKGEFFVASNDYRLGTRLKICSEDDGSCRVATVLDRGGFEKHGRNIDLCKKLFSVFAPLQTGIIKVKIEEVV